LEVLVEQSSNEGELVVEPFLVLTLPLLRQLIFLENILVVIFQKMHISILEIGWENSPSTIAHNKCLKRRGLRSLDSQQVARRLGGRYVS
jgi:hypothetical protein